MSTRPRGTGFFRPNYDAVQPKSKTRRKHDSNHGSRGPCSDKKVSVSNQGHVQSETTAAQGHMQNAQRTIRFSPVGAMAIDTTGGPSLLQCTPRSSVSSSDMDSSYWALSTGSGDSFGSAISSPYGNLSPADSFCATPRNGSSGLLFPQTLDPNTQASQAALSNSLVQQQFQQQMQDQQYQLQQLQQQQQQALAPQCYYDVIPVATLGQHIAPAAAVADQDLADLLLLQQQEAEVDAAITNLVNLRQQLTAMHRATVLPATSAGSFSCSSAVNPLQVGCFSSTGAVSASCAQIMAVQQPVELQPYGLPAVNSMVTPAQLQLQLQMQMQMQQQQQQQQAEALAQLELEAELMCVLTLV